jgi:hypothetical protein
VARGLPCSGQVRNESAAGHDKHRYSAKEPPMFESLEDRQFMSVSLMTTETATITDGTSNTVVVADQKTTKPKGGTTQQTYLTVTMSDILVSSYQ